MRLFRVMPYAVFLCVIVCWGGGCLAAQGGLAPGAPFVLAPEDPDPYESAPFSDSTSSTCGNLLVVGDVQDHTLHVSTDHDWGTICVDSVDANNLPVEQSYELRVSDWTIPSADWVTADLYDESGSLLVERFIHQADTQPQQLVFGATGTKRFYYDICRSGFSPSGVAYRVQVYKASAPNNGTVSQIGANRVSVGWPNGNTAAPRSATVIGYTIARKNLVDGTSVTLTSAPIPCELGCDCPPAFQTPGAKCQEYVDTIPIPDPNPGAEAFEYWVYKVLSDGTVQLIDSPPPMPIIVNFVVPGSGSAFCSGSGVCDWLRY